MKKIGFLSLFTLMLAVIFCLKVSAYSFENGALQVSEDGTYQMLVDTKVSYSLTEAHSLFNSEIVTVDSATSIVEYTELSGSPNILQVDQYFIVIFNGSNSCYINGVYDDDAKFEITKSNTNITLDQTKTFTSVITANSIRGKRYDITSITTGTMAVYVFDSGPVPFQNSATYTDGI